MEIEQEEYRVWMKETYGSMTHSLARDYNDYYTDEEHGMTREVLTREYTAQITSSKEIEGESRQDGERDNVERFSEELAREVEEATQNIWLVLIATQTMEKERMRKLDYDNSGFWYNLGGRSSFS
jgi:dipeptidase